MTTQLIQAETVSTTMTFIHVAGLSTQCQAVARLISSHQSDQEIRHCEDIHSALSNRNDDVFNRLILNLNYQYNIFMSTLMF